MRDISLRRVSWTDSQQLLEWANEPSVRMASLRDDTEITADEHKEWLNQKLDNHSTFMWILEVNRISCGVIRFEENRGDLTLSYLIDKRFRRQGLGKQILFLGIEKIRELGVGRCIIATVKNSNKKSMNALLQSGFHQTLHRDNIVKFKYALH